MTATTLTGLEQRIRSYHSSHGTLPPDLNSLPLRPEKSNDLSDGWGHPIEYIRESDSLYHIRSLGADGEIDGTGDNSDVVRTVNVEPPQE
ncbi:type II secretion system protein GspG [Symmachiella dynata]